MPKEEKLTEKETIVLRALRSSVDAVEGSWGSSKLSTAFQKSGMSLSSFNGYLASLQKKGFYHPPVYENGRPDDTFGMVRVK